MAKKKKGLNLGFVVSCVACLLAIVGFCMVFTNGFIYVDSGSLSVLGFSGSGKANYPGLGVVFGGTHDVMFYMNSAFGNSSNAISTDFSFNAIGCIAFVLALAGGIVGIFGSKNKIIAFFACAAALIGTIMVFFVVNGYALANSTDNLTIDPSSFKWGIGYIIAIVCFCLETLCLAYDTFLAIKK